jgi:hypothetical protein
VAHREVAEKRGYEKSLDGMSVMKGRTKLIYLKQLESGIRLLLFPLKILLYEVGR